MDVFIAWLLGAITVLGLQFMVRFHRRVRAAQSEHEYAPHRTGYASPPSPAGTDDDEAVFLTDIGFRMVPSRRRVGRPVRPGPRGSIVR